jgi:hypothetical protein
MSFLSSIFAPGEQARSDELDQQRIDLEKRRADLGYITPEQAQANIANIASQKEDVSGDLNQAFGEGLKEGYDAETGGIKKTLAFPFKFIWDALPWQIWLGGLVALFVYMGGWVWIKGILLRKK